MKKLLFILVMPIVAICSLAAETAEDVVRIPEVSENPDTEFAYELPWSGAKARAVVLSPVQAQYFNADHLVNFRAFEFQFKEPQMIVAARSGEVVSVEDRTVIIQHRDGSVARYSSLDRDGIVVKAGDKIPTCAPIGYTGSSQISDKQNVVTFELYHRSKNTVTTGRRANIPVLNRYIDPLFKVKKKVVRLKNGKQYKVKNHNIDLTDINNL